MRTERQEKMFKLAEELLGLMSKELKDSMKEQVENHHYEMAMNCLEDGSAFTDKCIALMRKTQDMYEIMSFLDERKWLDTDGED